MVTWISHFATELMIVIEEYSSRKFATCSYVLNYNLFLFKYMLIRVWCWKKGWGLFNYYCYFLFHVFISFDLKLFICFENIFRMMNNLLVFFYVYLNKYLIYILLWVFFFSFINRGDGWEPNYDIICYSVSFFPFSFFVFSFLNSLFIPIPLSSNFFIHNSLLYLIIYYPLFTQWEWTIWLQYNIIQII